MTGLVETTLNIRKEEPNEAESKQEAGNQTHPGVERPQSITRVKTGGEGVVSQRCQPEIAVTEAAANTAQVTDEMGTAI